MKIARKSSEIQKLRRQTAGNGAGGFAEQRESVARDGAKKS